MQKDGSRLPRVRDVNAEFVVKEERMRNEDLRFTRVRHLHAECAFEGYSRRSEWLARADELRQRLRMSLGLCPPPARTPLNAHITDRILRDDYTVEKVSFESRPGFFVAGNLYRPRRGQGPFPAVLHPHGHHKRGRLGDDSEVSLPAVSIALARQGFVVFLWDMIGYHDSMQLAHDFADPATRAGRRLNLWGISLMGLQTWNSIRVIDFLQSLPDVDGERIGCTGASGGGTQTFMVCAVDDRVKVAAPVNMISCYMQGGCLCENGPNVRIGTNNMEIAALFAPKPMLMVSCTGDWTVNTETIEFPAVRRIYELFGATEHLHHMRDDAPHNYNRNSREAVCGFFAHHLAGRRNSGPVREKPYRAETMRNTLVFPDKRLPAIARSEAAIVRSLIAESEQQLDALRPRTRPGLAKFRRAYRPALRHALSVGEPEQDRVLIFVPGKSETRGIVTERFSIGRVGEGDRVPAVFFSTSRSQRRSPATLLVHGKGKQALLDSRGRPGRLVRSLLARGRAVLGIDCFLTGESRCRRGQIDFFTTYNRTDTAERVQDILTALTCLRGRPDVAPGRIGLAGIGEAGLWCLLAMALTDRAHRAAIDACQFESAKDAAYLKDLFVPLLRRAGDLRAAGAMVAPRPLLLHNTGAAFKTDWITGAYSVAQAGRSLRVLSRKAGNASIVDWLTAS